MRLSQKIWGRSRTQAISFGRFSGMAFLVLLFFFLQCVNCIHGSSIDNTSYASLLNFDWRNATFKFLRNKVMLRKWNILQNVSDGCYKDASFSGNVYVTFTFPYFAMKGDADFLAESSIPNPVLLRKVSPRYGLFKESTDSVKEIWPTLCLCIIWAMISGIIIWFLVSTK